MKSAPHKILLSFCLLLLFAACKQTSAPTDDSLVYKSDPRLKDVTDKIKNTPNDASLYFTRGKMLAKLNQDTLALRDFKRASALDSNNATYYSAIGELLFENKDIAGSVEWLQRAIKINPKDPKAHLKIAKMFLFTQDYPKAFEQINIVLRQDIYNPEAYFLKAMVYKDMKDTTKAITNFQTAVQVDPNFKEAVLQLGLIYSARNDPMAIKYLDNAYRMDSSDVYPVFARGVYYQNNNDFITAKQLYRKCIILNTHFFDAYFNLGYLLMQQDSVEKAYRMYDLVTKMQPDNPTAYYDRGVCNEMMKKIPEAAADYKRAITLDTSYQSPKIALKRING